MLLLIFTSKTARALRAGTPKGRKPLGSSSIYFFVRFEQGGRKLYKIKFYGLGGQGVVTAANILSHAVSLQENKYAKTFPAYGHERRGAPVFSDIMVDEKPILLNSFVYDPDIVGVFDASVMAKGIDIGKGIHEKTKDDASSDACRHSGHGKNNHSSRDSP